MDLNEIFLLNSPQKTERTANSIKINKLRELEELEKLWKGENIKSLSTDITLSDYKF